MSLSDVHGTEYYKAEALLSTKKCSLNTQPINVLVKCLKYVFAFHQL